MRFLGKPGMTIIEEKMSLSVLTIENNDINRRFMTDLIENAGHQNHEMASGIDALNFLEKTSVDLVISDYFLEEGTADIFLSHLREHHPDLPVWLVSGVEQDKISQLCRELNLIHLVKPLDIGHFFNMLKQQETICQRVS